MTTLQHVRNTLGLTVAQLADYLRVTTSQITMSQSGRRNLPSHATIQLNRLLMAMQAVQPSIKTPSALPASANIDNTIIDTTLQLRDLQQKLLQMQQQYVQAQTVLQVKAVLEQQPTTDPLEALWLEAIAADATTALKNNSLEMQALLTIDAQILDYKIALLKAL